jgi:hypothetical protein
MRPSPFAGQLFDETKLSFVPLFTVISLPPLLSREMPGLAKVVGVK